VAIVQRVVVAALAGGSFHAVRPGFWRDLAGGLAAADPVAVLRNYTFTKSRLALGRVVPVIWIGLFIFTRFRWFKADRRDFPNDKENV
jgi:hypothetical protein